MDEGSDGRFWPRLVSFFRKHDPHLAEHIQEAQEDGEIKSEEVNMLLSILDLSDTKVTEVMVPRTDISCIDLESDIRDVADLIMECGHSRILVHEGNRDHMIGVIHAKDLIKPLLDSESNTTLDQLLRQVHYVPESLSIKTLLREFQSKKMHLAVVLDEYGGTSGIVTIEDILEEIVGEIEDEYDADRPEDILEIDDGLFEVSGRVSLEDLRERLDMKLDSDQVETLGGYLSQLSGRIPQAGEFFNIEGRRLTIKEADAKHIMSVLIEPAEPVSAEPTLAINNSKDE